MSIDSETFTRGSYTDTDHQLDTIWRGFGTLVRKFVVRGDTDGPEAGSKTGMYAYLNPISLTVRKPAGPHVEVIEEPSSVIHIPELIEGDREFAGNGPKVDVWAAISIQNTNEVWATVHMFAKETRSDWTTAAKIDGYKLWDGDQFGVKEIVSIDSDTFTSASYTDTDHAEDVLEQPAGDLVKRFRMTGDTRGTDVQHLGGTKARIEFNPIRLTVLR